MRFYVWGKTDGADQVLHFRWRSSTTGAPAVIRNRDGALNSYEECKKIITDAVLKQHKTKMVSLEKIKIK